MTSETCQSHNDRSRVVGGTKGHVQEEITGSILCLYEAYEWRMIPKCSGRHTCRNHEMVSKMTPSQLLEYAGIECRFIEYEFSLSDRDDKVIVISVDDNNTTGLITYVKQDHSKSDDGTQSNRYVHTLNTPSGFRRKLQAIGITVTDSCIEYSP